MKRLIPILLLFITGFSSPSIFAQVELEKPNNYQFTLQKQIECTDVKSQDRTGTCWSFATASFLESEMIRAGKGRHNVSEMYVVRNIYRDKARNYILRQGKANFSQGSLSHDLIAASRKHGMVPEVVYSGMLGDQKKHDHSEMEAVLKGILDGVLKQKRPSDKWQNAFEAVLDVYLGPEPANFTYDGRQFTPESFASDMSLDPGQYVNITSYTHHPFYESFILEIPDNYSNGAYYNVPVDELQAIVDNALLQGYSVAWDGDVSEKGFSARKGIAVLPEDVKREDLFEEPGTELAVDQALRQKTFENFSTTDDHLMHFTGIAKDQKGTRYYLTKNSWGEISPYKGYLYMSEPYFRLKTVAVMVHKDAIPKKIAKKLNL